MSSLSKLIEFARNDLAKLIRFAAVSAITVPLGLFLLWLFLEVFEWAPLVANLVAVTLATIPNYLLNRYWVWNKQGKNSVTREVAPFWIMALLGALLSTALIWLAEQFTDSTLVFLGANFVAFGLVWLLKFFVLENYLFGTDDAPAEAKNHHEVTP